MSKTRLVIVVEPDDGDPWCYLCPMWDGHHAECNARLWEDVDLDADTYRHDGGADVDLDGSPDWCPLRAGGVVIATELPVPLVETEARLAEVTAAIERALRRALTSEAELTGPARRVASLDVGELRALLFMANGEMEPSVSPEPEQPPTTTPTPTGDPDAE